MILLRPDWKAKQRECGREKTSWLCVCRRWIWRIFDDKNGVTHKKNILFFRNSLLYLEEATNLEARILWRANLVEAIDSLKKAIELRKNDDQPHCIRTLKWRSSCLIELNCCCWWCCWWCCCCRCTVVLALSVQAKRETTTCNWACVVTSKNAKEFREKVVWNFWIWWTAQSNIISSPSMRNLLLKQGR